jgi:RNA polymerase sigma-70 factor (ECF subfamily)
MRPPLDEARLRQIYRETIDALYAYVSRRCGGVREAAEDVTQETWLRAVRDWARNGTPDTPLAWLTTVSRNLILNQARRPEPSGLDTLSAAEVLAAVEPDDVDGSAEIAAIVTEAIERLPSEETKLLKTFHYDRVKVAEIARNYGISERAVEGRLRRARQRLRQELEITLKAEGGLP